MSGGTITELNRLMGDRGVSVVEVLQKAIELADEVSNENYKLLFEVHLSGQSQEETAKLLKENNWVYSAFFKDRKRLDTTLSLTGSASNLERNLASFEKDLEAAYEEQRIRLNAQPNISRLTLGIRVQAIQGEMRSVAEVISRIRLRAGEFARLVKKDLKSTGVTHSSASTDVPSDSKKVFVVHGHDDAVKQSVARFLERLDLEPIILHEQANRGRTIIEKFEQHSDVRFAIVLLTPDDYGNVVSKPTEPNERARQNVVFELGFFFAKLGRENVCALVKSAVERPSDIDGIVYLPMDDADGWKLSLGRELRAAGIDVDLNRTI